MRILLTGGGSGGHITPLLAVAQKLKSIDNSVEVIYIGERDSKFADMITDKPEFDQQYQIFAGKFRRYHGESWLQRLLDVKTNLQNLRDAVFVLLGTVQSWFLLRRLKPDVILLKGGYVGVPVGLAARRKYPMVTHDSDAVPGLANRLAGRWARLHATALPAEQYRYSAHSVRQTGVLVGEAYQPVTTDLRAKYRQELKLPADAQVLLITGGSLGAEAINLAMAKIAPELLETFPNLQILHQAGRGKTGCYGEFKDSRLQVFELVEGLHRYSGAADVVVTRAGANSLAELGVQGKACVVVPNPYLSDGHQLQNARLLAEKQAIVLVTEASLEQNGAASLQQAIHELLQNDSRRQQLGAQLQRMTIPDAADKLARLLLDVANPSQEA